MPGRACIASVVVAEAALLIALSPGGGAHLPDLEAASGTPDATVMKVHRDALVIDLHVDTLLDLAAGKRTLAASTSGHVDLPRLRRGGVDVQVFAAFVHPREAPHGLTRARELITAFQTAVRGHSADLVHARTVTEIEQVVRQGKIAGVLSIENGGDATEGDIANIDLLSRLGVRMMGLVWNQANAFADGALEQRHGGITERGRRALARMQALGMVVDVSHLSEAGFWQVLDATTGPIVASHSDAAAVQPHPRNLSDAQLHALAARGGVVGVNFYPAFLGAATLEQVVAHIDHMVKVMGVDFVALGSDFDGIQQVPRGLEDVSRLPNLTKALLDKGYTAEQVQKILGGNALRVFRAVWGR